jgi:hypothetical protein
MDRNKFKLEVAKMILEIQFKEKEGPVFANSPAFFDAFETAEEITKMHFKNPKETR